MFSPHHSSSSSMRDVSASPPREVIQIDVPRSENSEDSADDLFKQDFDNIILQNEINNNKNGAVLTQVIESASEQSSSDDQISQILQKAKKK